MSVCSLRGGHLWILYSRQARFNVDRLTAQKRKKKKELKSSKFYKTGVTPTYISILHTSILVLFQTVLSEPNSCTLSLTTNSIVYLLSLPECIWFSDIIFTVITTLDPKRKYITILYLLDALQRHLDASP